MRQNRTRSLHSSIWRTIEIHSQDGHVSYYPLSSTGELQISFPRQKRRNFHSPDPIDTSIPLPQPESLPNIVPIPLKKKFEPIDPVGSTEILLAPKFSTQTPLIPILTQSLIKFPLIPTIPPLASFFPTNANNESQPPPYILEYPFVNIQSTN